MKRFLCWLRGHTAQKFVHVALTADQLELLVSIYMGLPVRETTGGYETSYGYCDRCGVMVRPDLTKVTV